MKLDADAADLIEVEIQALAAIVEGPRQCCGLRRAATRTLGGLDCCHVYSRLIVIGVVAGQRRNT